MNKIKEKKKKILNKFIPNVEGRGPVRLTKGEQKIERDFGSYKPMKGAKLKRVQGILSKAKKKKMVSIRMEEELVEAVKALAISSGHLSYQPFIRNILIRFVKGQLVDKNELEKILAMQISPEEIDKILALRNSQKEA